MIFAVTREARVKCFSLVLKHWKNLHFRNITTILQLVTEAETYVNKSGNPMSLLTSGFALKIEIRSNSRIEGKVFLATTILFLLY